MSCRQSQGIAVETGQAEDTGSAGSISSRGTMPDPISDDLSAVYNFKYRDEEFRPTVLRPYAFTTNRYDDVARLLRRERGEMLEIGSGSGGLTIALANRFERLVGIDLSDVRVDRANRVVRARYPQYADKVRFQVARADGRLPFADASFDAIVACAVLEHVVDLFSTVDEIARLCRRGGCLVVTVPNICYVRHVKDLLFSRIPLTGSPTRDIDYWRDHGWDGYHLHYFSKASLGTLLRHVGFEPEEWTGDGRLARLRRWCANLVGNLTVRARKR